MLTHEDLVRYMSETNGEFRVECAGTGLVLDGIPSDELIRSYVHADDAVAAYLDVDGYWCPLTMSSYVPRGSPIARVFLR